MSTDLEPESQQSLQSDPQHPGQMQWTCQDDWGMGKGKYQGRLGGWLTSLQVSELASSGLDEPSHHGLRQPSPTQWHLESYLKLYHLKTGCKSSHGFKAKPN